MPVMFSWICHEPRATRWRLEHYSVSTIVHACLIFHVFCTEKLHWLFELESIRVILSEALIQTLKKISYRKVRRRTSLNGTFCRRNNFGLQRDKGKPSLSPAFDFPADIFLLSSRVADTEKQHSHLYYMPLTIGRGCCINSVSHYCQSVEPRS